MLNSEFSGGEESVVRRLGELGFELVDTGEHADDEALVLPQGEVDAFVETMASDEYARDERDYKIAVHEVVTTPGAGDPRAPRVSSTPRCVLRAEARSPILASRKSFGNGSTAQWGVHRCMG